MSKDVSLQADVGHIPNNTLSTLNAISPFIQAVSADNVSPLAVVQIEALGACFHLNGDLASKVPDLLSRSTSYRLERLSHWIGWRAGDTASYMAQTAGGRAASVLSLALVELYKEEQVGHLLYQLSSTLLPLERNQSSKAQVAQVASTLSKKLSAFGFGNHLAFHVTRIREVYLNSGKEIPQNLLVFPTVETMTEFLHCLSRALQEEQSILYFEGCAGVAYMVAIVMAMCPEDAFVAIEGEVVFQGTRRSVFIDIRIESKTNFSVESILYDSSGTRNNPHIVSIDSTQKIFSSPISLKWDGCLSDALDLAFANIGAYSAVSARIACVELISCVIFSLRGSDLHNRAQHFIPEHGFLSLLGSDDYALRGVRDTLKRIFNCEPSFSVLNWDNAVDDLCVKIAEAVCPSVCTCKTCFHDGRFTLSKAFERRSRRRCKVLKLWYIIDGLVTRGIVATFVSAKNNSSIRLSSDQRSNLLTHIWNMFNPRSELDSTRNFRNVFYAVDLHATILDLVSKFKVSWKEKNIGISSGASSIFAATVQTPVFQNTKRLEYILADGQFHDEHNYYQTLTCEHPRMRSLAITPLHNSTIIPSTLGAHTSLTLTARGVGNQLTIRTVVQMSSKTFPLDFYKQHMAYMSVIVASACGHNTRSPLSQNMFPVTPTSVAAPTRQQPDYIGNHYHAYHTYHDTVEQWRKSLREIGIVLTHKNAEAQFLACATGASALFQGDSCLNCAVEEAYDYGYDIVIQS
jgi:hypothetical protein